MKTLLTSALVLISTFVFSQDLSKANSSNTWAKAGINIGVPFGPWTEVGGSSAYTAGIGIDLSIQFIETKASGIGIKTGYLSYLGKDGTDNVSIIPLAIMYRFYPEDQGWFAGFHIGYGFINNHPQLDGGVFTRFDLGLHTDYWNFFGYYDFIATEESQPDPQTIGLGVTRNIFLK